MAFNRNDPEYQSLETLATAIADQARYSNVSVICASNLQGNTEIMFKVAENAQAPMQSNNHADIPESRVPAQKVNPADIEKLKTDTAVQFMGSNSEGLQNPADVANFVDTYNNTPIDKNKLMNSANTAGPQTNVPNKMV